MASEDTMGCAGRSRCSRAAVGVVVVGIFPDPDAVLEQQVFVRTAAGDRPAQAGKTDTNAKDDR